MTVAGEIVRGDSFPENAVAPTYPGNSERSPPPVAIVGAGYAGLALANILHLRSIPYAVFDDRSPPCPCAHVEGGAKFNLPSYEVVAKKLNLHATGGRLSDGGPTREAVVESLLRRVRTDLVAPQRVVGVENKSGHFYLRCVRRRGASEPSDARLAGPFLSVVGADGVLSGVRARALQGTFLIGDARWAKDRWYDLGLRRIDRGADIALLDGLELGEAMSTKGDGERWGGWAAIARPQVRRKFCVREISRRRTIWRFSVLAIIVAMIISNSPMCSIGHEAIWAFADSIFRNDCLSHDRDNPLVTFQFHEKLREWMGLDGTYAVLLPNPFFWIQISVLIMIQSIVAVMFAITIYNGIIQRRGSTSSYLLCWGVLLPFTVTFPIYLIRFFMVQNRAVRLSTAATPTLVSFRCLEALYGFSPHSVEDSVWNYCIYFSSVIEFVFDENTRLPAKATRENLLQKGKGLVVNLILVSLLLSFMEAHAYKPFGMHDGGINAKYIQPGHIGNNFLNALLTSATLATATTAFGFAICGLAGIQTLDVCDNPIFKSSSVLDFWGRRWNRLVHGVLKRGVYKPVRKHLSKSLAPMATFLMSGILHEYILFLITVPSSKNAVMTGSDVHYEPSYGSQSCFFAWNGMLMMLENIIFVNWRITMKLKLSAPPYIISILVIALALPVAHWFTDEYVRSAIFSHYAVGFPIVSRMK